MPLLHSAAERYALRAGTYTIGGQGHNAVPLAALDHAPEVATIVVPASGAPTIQRLAASVVVRLNGTAIGIAPTALPNGVEIEFDGRRLILTKDNVGACILTSASTVGRDDDRLASELGSFADDSIEHGPKSFLVNVHTGAALHLFHRRVVIGRDPACDLIVPGMGVSRRHCSITPVDGGYLLRDESANGTLVNGARVCGTYLLGHGDIVRIADDELRFEVEGAPASSPSATPEPTAILDASRLRAEHAAAGASERSAVTLVANLEIVRGPYSGASFPIDRPVCSIGRAADSDIRIRDESVSANHATLLRKGATWFVVDLRSANGTFVDGLRIAGERELTSGSRLKLGRVELMFRALDCEVEITNARHARSWIRESIARFLFRSTPTVSEDA